MLKAESASKVIRREDSKVPDPKRQKVGMTLMRLPVPLKLKGALQIQPRT